MWEPENYPKGTVPWMNLIVRGVVVVISNRVSTRDETKSGSEEEAETPQFPIHPSTHTNKKDTKRREKRAFGIMDLNNVSPLPNQVVSFRVTVRKRNPQFDANHSLIIPKGCMD